MAGRTARGLPAGWAGIGHPPIGGGGAGAPVLPRSGEDGTLARVAPERGAWHFVA